MEDQYINTSRKHNKNKYFDVYFSFSDEFQQGWWAREMKKINKYCLMNIKGDLTYFYLDMYIIVVSLCDMLHTWGDTRIDTNQKSSETEL